MLVWAVSNPSSGFDVNLASERCSPVTLTPGQWRDS